ncbi:uncharacterized protein [Primulina eburnea]|uniref:uncharacterized protein n=1 Tax=Primulina eburnea TaxID=1245227 RepID=UPI003C6C0F15
MEQLVPRLSELQLKRIEASPVAPWLKIEKLSISTSRVYSMLKRFEVETCSFCFGSNIKVPFTSRELSIVIGLASVGQPVNLDLKLSSNFLERHFKGVHCVQRNVITEKLFELAGNDLEIDDFFRFFILLLFNCVIFPISNFGTPKFIFPYLDNLETFFGYGWGDAAFRFLRDEIADHLGFSKVKRKDKKYMGGCIVGLMAWVYERVPMLGEPRVLHCFPRLFKWVESKIPVNPIRAEAALMAVRSNKIVPIKPFEDEKKLVDDIERIFESRYNDSELLEHIKRLENEIKVLKEKNEVVEDDTTQFVFKDATHMYDEGHTEQDVDAHVDDS